MKQTLILLGIVAILGGGAYFMLQSKKQETKEPSSFKNDAHTQFAIYNPDEVHRVMIADWGKNKASVERNGDGTWTYTNMMTNKTFQAREDAINNLLRAIEKVRVRFPVPQPAIDNVVSSMTGRSRKVEIYDKAGNKIKAYSVGGPADGGEGTHMLMEGEMRPCVTYIPSFQGSLHNHYVVTEEWWRDRAVFRVNPQQLEYVEVEYLDERQSENSFRIEQNGGTPKVNPASPKAEELVVGAFSEDMATTYLEDFDEVVAEKILDDKILRDSIITQVPFATVEYKTTKDAEAKRFKIFPLINPTADRGDGQRGTRTQLERYYVDAGEDRFYLVQDPVIRKVLMGYPYFFRPVEG